MSVYTVNAVVKSVSEEKQTKKGMPYRTVGLTFTRKGASKPTTLSFNAFGDQLQKVSSALVADTSHMFRVAQDKASNKILNLVQPKAAAAAA